MINGKTIEIKTNNWERSTERFIGFIDIMGFKDLVARNNEEVLYLMMRRIRESTFQNLIIHGVEDPEDGYESNIYITTYSDSIIVYSKDNTEQNLNSFINAISGLTNDLIRNAIPHKGAIAYGLMTLDFKNSIFFGQPLIDAYLLHDELSFYGIVVHATADSSIRACGNKYIFEYNCPFKSGVSKHLTILSEFLEPDPLYEISYNDCYRAIEKLRQKTSGSLRMYIDRTLQYLESFKNAQTEIVYDK